MLQGIQRIHSCVPPEAIETPPLQLEGEEVSCNYSKKLRSRYIKFKDLYQTFSQEVPEIDGMFDSIVGFLDEYVSSGRYQSCHYIHGDPVFSNCLLSNTSGSVCFIDMRGALGGRLTTQGDRLYDLSKIFQSLCGYDFMLLDQPVSHRQLDILTELRAAFWEHTLSSASDGEASLQRDVTMITASHFFTIVPLHEVRDRQLAYLIKSKELLQETGLLPVAGTTGK